MKTQNIEKTNMALNISKEGVACAGNFWKTRPATIHRMTDSEVEFTVKGYSYTLGARRGNTGSYNARGYAKAQRFIAHILSNHTSTSGWIHLEVEAVTTTK